MIDMIRVGQTRNLLRASNSLLEIWPRSAHHHLGQRHLSGRANSAWQESALDHKSKVQKFLANEGGIHKRRFGRTRWSWSPGSQPGTRSPMMPVIRKLPDTLSECADQIGTREPFLDLA